MRFTSLVQNPNPLKVVYRAQRLFLGELSLKYFAARIRHARNMRWGAHGTPRDIGSRRDLNLSRYTSVGSSVSAFTLDDRISCQMNCSTVGKVGSSGCIARSWIRGAGRLVDLAAFLGCTSILFLSQGKTLSAAAARCRIIERSMPLVISSDNNLALFIFVGRGLLSSA